jgi:hypothetical protein
MKELCKMMNTNTASTTALLAHVPSATATMQARASGYPTQGQVATSTPSVTIERPIYDASLPISS